MCLQCCGRISYWIIKYLSIYLYIGHEIDIYLELDYVGLSQLGVQFWPRNITTAEFQLRTVVSQNCGVHICLVISLVVILGVLIHV